VVIDFECFKFLINKVHCYSLFKISSISRKSSHLVLSNYIIFYVNVFGSVYVFVVVLSVSL
jgi:hypothetical protein